MTTASVVKGQTIVIKEVPGKRYKNYDDYLNGIKCNDLHVVIDEESCDQFFKSLKKALDLDLRETNVGRDTWNGNVFVKPRPDIYHQCWIMKRRSPYYFMDPRLRFEHRHTNNYRLLVALIPLTYERQIYELVRFQTKHELNRLEEQAFVTRALVWLNNFGPWKHLVGEPKSLSNLGSKKRCIVPKKWPTVITD